ncbi:hypothetical protein BDZ91DRAFT_781718 [Kalaharituber pfeilii]|nr:hypothetical protein BDZ91DRAFT_781718 [Kalaharituber pfeilii]
MAEATPEEAHRCQTCTINPRNPEYFDLGRHKLGGRGSFNGKEYTVLGVCEDVRDGGLHGEMQGEAARAGALVRTETWRLSPEVKRHIDKASKGTLWCKLSKTPIALRLEIDWPGGEGQHRITGAKGLDRETERGWLVDQVEARANMAVGGGAVLPGAGWAAEGCSTYHMTYAGRAKQAATGVCNAAAVSVRLLFWLSRLSRMYDTRTLWLRLYRPALLRPA